MNIETFFAHWDVIENPFRAEEAKDDPVYRRLMDQPVAHPDFAKIFGDPEHPDTSVVFGEKGTGKTALKLLMEQRYRQHNQRHPDKQVYVVRYDDLNPAIDRVVRHLQPSNPADALKAFRLQDHLDAILSRAVTSLLDLVMGEAEDPALTPKRLKALRRMDKRKRIDLYLLAILYDHPPSGHSRQRFRDLARFLRLGWLTTVNWNKAATAAAVAAWLAALIAAPFLGLPVDILSLVFGVVILGLLGAWGVAAIRLRWLARKVLKEMRVIERDSGTLAGLLAQLPKDDLTARPLPLSDEQDIRYQYVARFLDIVEETGVVSLVVLVDRVDEPNLVHGDPGRIRSLIWPMLDNKFLQQDRTGLKLLLPIDLRYLLIKEDPGFFQKARLDKQNFIEKLEWTGSTLYDVCSRRLQACRTRNAEEIRLTDLFEDVSREMLVDALDQMHQPRDAFKFLYQVIQEHCRNTEEEAPVFKIPRLILDQVRRQQSERVQAFYRGLAPA